LVTASLFTLAVVAVGCGDAGGDAANREVRDRLEEIGIDPSSSLLYEHFLYFPDEDGANAAAAELGGEFDVGLTGPDDEFPDWLLLATQRASLTGDEIDALTRRLTAIAAEHGGDYDGWGVPLDG
jgi:regulator of RNase E activity RraB